MSTLHDLITADPDVQDYWPLADGSGSTAADAEGTAGPVTGTVTWNPTGVPDLDGRGSVLLDGSTSYVTSFYQYILPATGSIEVWFYPPDHATLSTPGGLHLLAGYLGGDPVAGDTEIGAAAFTRYQSGHWDAIIKLPVPSSGNTVETSLVASIHLTEGAWNQVVIAWTPTTGKIYVNGAAAGSYPATDWFSDTGEFYLGAFTTAGFYIGGGYAGGGSTSTIYDTPGAFSNVATFYNDELTPTEVLAHYDAATGGSFDVVATTGLWVALDSTGAAAPVARVTSLKLEVLEAGDGTQAARVSSLAVEVLVSVAHLTETKTASTGLRLGLGGAEHADFARPAATGVWLADPAVGFDLAVKHCTTEIYVGVPVRTRRIYVESASTGVWAGSGGRQRSYDADGNPLTPDNDVALDATTGLFVGLAAAEIVAEVYFAAASTGLRLGLGVASPNSIAVAATTGLSWRLLAPADVVTVIHFVSAATALRLATRGGSDVSAQYAVGAITALDFVHVARPDLDHAYAVVATTSLRLGHHGAEVRDAATRAATGLLAGLATARGREIHVSAVTGLMASLGDASNEFIARTGPTGLWVGDAASLVVGGIDVDTGLVFGHLATAEVWLPWRRADLTLDPGGQIPH